MSHLAKLNLKTVQRSAQTDPVVARREKLTAKLDQQKLVLAAMREGKRYEVGEKHWRRNDNGERVLVDVVKQVRAWFFEQDNGWYVQCRYGNRVLNISGRSNAVFVNKLDEIAAVLDSLSAAAESGELDKALLLAAKSMTASG
jgi:frataxin-like iron-binding protein CyaY